MFILSGFADEISDDLNTQIDAQQAEREPSGTARRLGQNVLTLSDDEIETVRQSLTERGIKVSAIGSPIGKIDIEDPFEPHLDDFRRAIQIARALDCPYIRIFSFFVPEDKADDYRPQVMERMQALLDVARGEPVTLLHENERHIYGDIPRRCRDLFETLASPQLRMTFDPANFVMCDVRPFTEGYELLKDYIDYVHIKDGLMEEKRVVPAGQGDGRSKSADSPQETRLRRVPLAGASSGPRRRFSGFSGPDLFGIAVNARDHLLAQIDE